MSSFVRTLEKRILKKKGYVRNINPKSDDFCMIMNLEGEAVGKHYPRP
jgi:hypothetical protein